jgi:hypothetical protein
MKFPGIAVIDHYSRSLHDQCGKQHKIDDYQQLLFPAWLRHTIFIPDFSA